jgi:ABC-type amino acid transport substrate-binding protein
MKASDSDNPAFHSIVVSLLMLLALLIAPILAVGAENRSSLTVVMDDNYPPYIFRDANGKLSGYLVDSWKLWERKTGVPVKLFASDWAIAQKRMKDGQADVIDTIFKTPERESTLDFSPPYADIPVTIYTHSKIGGIVDMETLKGFLVGVKEGDACISHLESKEIQTLRPYSSYETLVRGAISGEVRVFCLDEPPANYLLYRDHAENDFRQAFRLYTGQFHRAVKKGASFEI